MENPERRIKELTKELNYHSKKYYVDDSPEISDFEYDKMLRELEILEEKYPEFASDISPTKRVGGKALSKFEEVIHRVKMESLQDAFNEEEIIDFDKRVSREFSDYEYVVEQKQLDELFIEISKDIKE